MIDKLMQQMNDSLVQLVERCEPTQSHKKSSPEKVKTLENTLSGGVIMRADHSSNRNKVC